MPEPAAQDLGYKVLHSAELQTTGDLTMQEIHQNVYEQVIPLFSSIQFHRPAVFCVLEGRQPGRVFVDRAKDPTAAIVNTANFYCFGGSPAALDLPKDVLGLLEHEVMPHQEHLICLWFSQPWQAALQAALQPCEPSSHEVTTFALNAARFRALHAGWRQRIPSGFTLKRMDASMVPGWLAESWGSAQNFYTNGFGYCLFDDAQPEARNEFTSNAQTVFLGDRHAGTGVGTEEAYRRRGLATTVCCAYIEHCLETGISPEWGCSNNEASERLAVSLGYGERRNWPLLYVHSPDYLAKKEGKNIL
jgi:hypothetical protein